MASTPGTTTTPTTPTRVICSTLGRSTVHAGSKHSLNVDGAFRHVMADPMGSVGVVISGVVVILTDWVLIDPILSIGIALLIVVSSWRLVLKSVNVLLGGVPEHLDLPPFAPNCNGEIQPPPCYFSVVSFG